jgi:hypothetical protein
MPPGQTLKCGGEPQPRAAAQGLSPMSGRLKLMCDEHIFAELKAAEKNIFV